MTFRSSFSGCCCLVTKLCPGLVTLWTVARQAPLSWDFPGKNTGVGCHFLLQRILLTQGSNPGLLHWQVKSLLLSHQGSPLFSVYREHFLYLIYNVFFSFDSLKQDSFFPFDGEKKLRLIKCDLSMVIEVNGHARTWTGVLTIYNAWLLWNLESCLRQRWQGWFRWPFTYLKESW